MPVTSNGSLYTISVVDPPSLQRSDVNTLRLNAVAAIDYLGEYIHWNGTLDFVIRWDVDAIYDWSLGNGFGGYGDIGLDGKTSALSEAITGVDANGSNFDGGTWISTGNSSLTSYGEEVFIDPSPNPKDDDIQETDFLSIFLHEVVHSLGMWSTAQHGEELYGKTSYDELTFSSGDSWYFDGPKVNEVYGGPLPLAADERSHYSDSLPSEHDLVREFSLPEKWQITDIDLAILYDLGIDVVKWRLKRSFLEKDNLYVRDFDGSMHGGASESVSDDYLYLGSADANDDGTEDWIYTNAESGRWALVEAAYDAVPDWRDYGSGGGTRVVGIYDDPLVLSGEVEAGSPHDSQVRFQNDLLDDNLRLGSAADVDSDGFGEVFWKTTDESAYLRSIHHLDGNVKYANYMNANQMTDYLSQHGHIGDIGSSLGL